MAGLERRCNQAGPQCPTGNEIRNAIILLMQSESLIPIYQSDVEVTLAEILEHNTGCIGCSKLNRTLRIISEACRYTVIDYNKASTQAVVESMAPQTFL